MMIMKKEYISHSKGLINDRINTFENSKGVIKFSKTTKVITDEGVKPLGVKFNMSSDLVKEFKKILKRIFLLLDKKEFLLY